MGREKDQERQRMQFRNVQEHDAYQTDADHEVFINSFKDWWAQVQVRDLA